MLVDHKDVPFPKEPPARYLQGVALTAALFVPRGSSILLAGLLLAAGSGLLRAQAPVPAADGCQADASYVDANRSPLPQRVPPVMPPRLKLDEARLMGILAQDPGNAGALAGMGWIRSQQGNFPGAISFLEQARLKRPKDHALAVALDLDRFRFLISEAQYSLASNDLIAARKRYLEALEVRPSNREASAGLNAAQIRISADGPPSKSSAVPHPCVGSLRVGEVQPPEPAPSP